MTKKQWSEARIKLCVDIPEELAKGIEMMANLKGISKERLLQFWIEDGLERDELRFERLLLFAEISEDLDEEGYQLLTRLKGKYFDEVADEERGLDSYLVKSRTLHNQYQATSSPSSIYAIK